MNLITKRFYFGVSGTSDSRTWIVPTDGLLMYIDFEYCAYMAAGSTGLISALCQVTRTSAQVIAVDNMDSIICEVRYAGWKIAAGGELPGANLNRQVLLGVDVKAGEQLYAWTAAGANVTIEGGLTFGMIPFR